MITDCVSNFEDLPNELIYEIFEYLDYYHSYQGFFDLKYRFRSLFTQSTVPFKINIDFISQSNFNSFNQDIIIPYRQRIHSLRVSNYFMFDSNSFVLSDKKFLQTLVIENLEPLDLSCILHQLKLLPNLSSLTFTTIDFVKDRNYIYQLIFQLPSLRYCKLSLGEKLELLVMLCPRLQHIEMGIAIKDIGPLLRFIVDDNNLNTRHLISFCFIDSNSCSFQHLTVLLSSKILFGKWKVLYVDKKSKLFLWT
ncbi:unnamed protein product [Adineta steineri]|uniref:F-box domain-containing protein n=1 Tax=Adineta steineri TaxID=433720 RepID=A0A814IS68_9BILA|nr:unnamed protein product [Adineta steineri]